MAITKTLKVIGKTKRKNLFEKLDKRNSSIFPKRIFNRAIIFKEYKRYRNNARKIILQTEHMLELFYKDPKLKDAQFVFLDRDGQHYILGLESITTGKYISHLVFKRRLIKLVFSLIRIVIV